jgi:xanthine/uracil permease
MVDLTLTFAADTEFLTAKALGTFTGASAATVAIGNTARYLAKRDLRVVPFLIALVFAYVAAEVTGHPNTVGEWALVLLNGCLLFCTAIGANQVLVSVVTESSGGVTAQGRKHREIRWLQSWYPGDEPETTSRIQRTAQPPQATTPTP